MPIRFLLAQLYMDSLATKGTPKAVRETLRALPRELNDTYDEAMERIVSQNDYDRQLAEHILAWISFATRPLTFKELQCALAVERFQTKLHEDNLIDKKLLTSVCTGLVTVDQRGIVNFFHPTTKEYFQRIRVHRFPAAQKEIAETCLTYLSFDEFANGPCSSDMEMDKRTQKNPFLDFAARYWGDHARGEPELALRDIIVNFLEWEANISSSIQAMSIGWYRLTRYSEDFSRNVSGLSVAAHFGMTETVKLLLSNAIGIEAEDSEGRTALHWATERGHELVTQILLDNGAEIEARDHSGWTALQMASRNSHLGIIRLFLQWNVDIDARYDEEFNHTALHLASESGHLEIFQLLLEQNADVNAEPASWLGKTALQGASENGYFNVVKPLLDLGADINAEPADGDGIMPLQATSVGVYLEIVRLLLEYGANVNSKHVEAYLQTPLQEASQGGYLAIVKLLLELGADVNAQLARK
jgi:ankyrin repeat protein